MINRWAVIIGDNPANAANIVAMFLDLSAATTWRDANAGGAAVREVIVTGVFVRYV